MSSSHTSGGTKATVPAKTQNVSTIGAAAIGLGGMMGAGLYTLLGLASTIAGVWVPLAFIVGGAVAAFSVYSYAKLGTKYPSRGGAGEFLIRTFGDTRLAGSLNVFQFLGWVIAMALYAVGFGGYAVDVLPWHMPDWAGKAFGIGLVLLTILINFIGSRFVSRSELFVVAIELVILVAFVGFGLFKADYSSFAHEVTSGGGSHWMGIFFAAGLLYVTYEGFGVVTNSAGAMKNPAKQLPRAMYSALIIVILVYVVVSAVVVLTMSLADMKEFSGHVLAEAGKAVMGRTGFVLLGGSAMLATASAVNATLFGDANLSFMMGSKNELPKSMSKYLWRRGTLGILVGAALTILFVLFFPLSDVGQMASLAFLLIYAAVSMGHLRVRKQTGAKAWLLWTAIILNMALFVLLIGYTISTKQTGTWVTLLCVIAASFLVEVIYWRVTGRHFRAKSFNLSHILNEAEEKVRHSHTDSGEGTGAVSTVASSSAGDDKARAGASSSAQ